jgi:hypothetical protein
MDQGFRRGFTTAEKRELRDRWQRGEIAKLCLVNGASFTSPAQAGRGEESGCPEPRRNTGTSIIFLSATQNLDLNCSSFGSTIPRNVRSMEWTNQGKRDGKPHYQR